MSRFPKLNHLPPGLLEQDVLEHRPVELPQLAGRIGEHGGGPRLAVHERQVSEARLDLVGWLVHVDGRTWPTKTTRTKTTTKGISWRVILSYII